MPWRGDCGCLARGLTHRSRAKRPFFSAQACDAQVAWRHEIVPKSWVLREYRATPNEALLDILAKIEHKMGISQPEDWYTVRLTDMHEMGWPKGVGTVRLAALLKEKYPQHKDWEKIIFMKGKFALQKHLERAIKTLFPGEIIQVNARKESGIINPTTGAFLELDVYLPSLKLAFEYQERHHYLKQTQFTDRPLQNILKRDLLKKDLVSKSGITLITVPIWWDNQLGSLVATIKRSRPDLAPQLAKLGGESSPIPESPPPGFFAKQEDFIEDIGEPANPCFFVGSRTDPTNWWMLEKYDGVRGFWNPIKKAFYSRKGNVLTLPPQVIEAMPPNTFLDGELWFGRDNFQEAMKIVYRKDDSQIDWNKFKYIVYDIPTSKATYAERYAQLCNELEGKDYKYLSLAQYEVCKDSNHLERFLQDIIDNGGEGIILRDPRSPFESGRSNAYLKHKKYRDAEAKIVKIISPVSWECELPNGTRFTALAGTTEFAKRYNPQPGDIVSFKHRGFLLASKKPKIPTLYRIRTDISWDDVLHNWKEQIVVPKVTPIRQKRKRKMNGYWESLQHRKRFLLDYADKMGFDPHVGENWRRQGTSLRTHEGAGLLNCYNGSVKAMLKDTFPQIRFKKEVDWPRLAKNRDGYWKDTDTRRKFLLDFAKKMDFDPLVASSWAKQRGNLLATPGGTTLLKIYGKYRLLLEDTFPELNFKDMKPEWSIPERPRGYWKDAENRKQFLLSFAHKMGFDPRMVANWKKYRRNLIAEGGGTLLVRYGKLEAMLEDTFEQGQMVEATAT